MQGGKPSFAGDTTENSMAGTSSIASRMEKLAQMKREKRALAGNSNAKAAVSPAPVALTPEPAPVRQPEPEPAPAPQRVAAAVPEQQVEPTISAPAEEFDINVSDDAPELSAAPEPEDDDAFMRMMNEEPEAADPAPAPAQAAAIDSAPEFEPVNNAAADAFASESSPSEIDDLGSEIPDDLLGGFDTDETVAVAADVTETPEAVSDSVPVPDPAQDSAGFAADLPEANFAAQSDVDAIAALAAAPSIEPEAEPTVAEPEVEQPDFTQSEIDSETLENEFAHEAEQVFGGPAAPAAAPENETGGRVSLTFDDERSTLLNHVSRQMNCSIDDIVVTALDWYLDALFGEDGEAKSA